MTVVQFLKAAPRGMLISVVIAFVLLNGLGIWQIERLEWKEDLIADMARTEAMPPVAARVLLAQTRPAWRSASLPPCTPRRVIYMHSEVDGIPGYRILVACSVNSGPPDILVDLGFATTKINIEMKMSAPVGRLRPYEKPGMVTPVNRPSADDWYWRSAADMAPVLQARLRGDYFVVLDLRTSDLAVPGLQQGPLTAPLPNRHMEYALTWFALGWTMLGMFGAFVHQRIRATAR